MSTMISVDFDFFIRHQMYEWVKFPNGEKEHGMLVFDWQMNEGRAPEFDAVIWETRVFNFIRWGLDIRAMTKPELSVQDFAKLVSARMGEDWSGSPSYYADSHAWAAIVARDYSKNAGEPLSLVNFDAHHDLTYSDKPNFNSENIACDNWVGKALHEGWVKDYTVVYPDWLGKAEFGKEIQMRKRKLWPKSVYVTTWKDWLRNTDEIPEVEVMFFCRSSAWVPPWYDSLFTELHEEFGYADCLDCLYGQQNSPYDPCQPREWNWDEIERGFQERESAHELLQGLMGIDKSSQG